MAQIWALSLVPVMLQAAALRTDLDDLQVALGVPTSIATVIDGSRLPGEDIPEFILLQDVHRHPEVQGHIASILLYGTKHWDLRDVFLEGADAAAAIAVPAAAEPQSLIEDLQAGRLSGAEMAVALEPNSPLQLHGLEDAGLYRENVAAYEAVAQLRGSAVQELETARFFQTSFDVGAPAPDENPLLQKMLQLRLKPAEHAEYLRARYQGHLGTSLTGAIRAAEHFYELADQRSDIFLKNVESGDARGPRLVVVGGYHTAKMAEELRQQGRSFAVLSPNVTQSGYDDLYARGMQQTISALKLH